MTKTMWPFGVFLFLVGTTCSREDDHAERPVGGSDHIFGVNAPRITIEELSGFITHERVVFVDVRSREDFESQHIPGAVSIPLSHLWFRWDEIPAADRVITYCACQGDVSSARAAVALLDRGLKNVAALQGGITQWIANGGKTEGKSSD
ncbi:MAG: rhodanese-like domain-containing protein [Vicinamibacteria bacterium]